MGFFDKLFSKKEQRKGDFLNSSIRKGEDRVFDINEENKKQEKEKECLTIFTKNKKIFTNVIIPMLEFAKQTGLSNWEIHSCIMDMKKFKKENFVETLKHISSAKRIKRSRLYEQIEYKFVDPKKVDELLWGLNEDIYYLRWFALKDNKIANETICSTRESLNRDVIYKDYYKFMLSLALVKAFTLFEIIEYIKEKQELYTILRNAYNKYQSIAEVVNKTYDLFFDYTDLFSQDFSIDDFDWCIHMLFSNFIEPYSLEELGIQENIESFSFSELIENIIDGKKYRNKNTEELLSSVLCEKLRYLNRLIDLLKILDEFKGFSKKIETAVLKEDLLNNDYSDESERISISDIDLMSGPEFEEFLWNYFNGTGYKCEQTKATGDQGVDLIAIKDDARIAIQAKCYSGVVGNHAIMEVFAGAKYYNANKCMVVTNSTFTKSAIELAKSNNVILWDRNVLIEKLSQI